MTFRFGSRANGIQGVTRVATKEKERRGWVRKKTRQLGYYKKNKVPCTPRWDAQATTRGKRGKKKNERKEKEGKGTQRLLNMTSARG